MRAGHGREPLAVGHSVKPRDGHNRLPRMREVWISPVWGRHFPRSVQNPAVLLNGDLRWCHRKGIEPNAMHRAFLRLTGVGSHREPAVGNMNSGWLMDRRPCTIGHNGRAGIRSAIVHWGTFLEQGDLSRENKLCSS